RRDSGRRRRGRDGEGPQRLRVSRGGNQPVAGETVLREDENILGTALGERTDQRGVVAGDPVPGELEPTLGEQAEPRHAGWPGRIPSRLELCPWIARRQRIRQKDRLGLLGWAGGALQQSQHQRQPVTQLTARY